MPLVCWGVSALPFCLLPFPFYSRFLHPEWGPLSRYLSYQPFPPVVGSGCKGKKAWLCQAQGTECNHDSFPFDISIFRCPFTVQWDDLECHCQWRVAPFVLSYIHAEKGSSHGQGGVFPGTRPLAQCGRWHGLFLVFYPPQT